MIHGACDRRFLAVREAFERNFAERGEVGAACCVTVDGEVVADLWGGVADPATGRPWSEDTIATVWSATKGALALCAHMLVARGQLDLDAPVATYWPEFARAGKEELPVRMLLNHQAGLAAVRTPLPEGAFYAWDAIAAALAAQEPFWTPGTMHGYHALTFGHLVGEVVRRVSGRTPGAYFRAEVGGPLDLDFWIGLPEDLEPRVAPNIEHDPPRPEDGLPNMAAAAMRDPGGVQALVLLNNGGLLAPGECNTRRFHAAEIPAANGITNARSLAAMYRPLALGGAYAGVRLVPPDAIAAMGCVASAGIDAFGLVPTRFSLGFMKAMDNRRQPPGNREGALLSEAAFGHVGFGGALGFADPGARMSLGYTPNKQRSRAVMCDRGQALVDATYTSLGYTLAPSGVWYG